MHLSRKTALGLAALGLAAGLGSGLTPPVQAQAALQRPAGGGTRLPAFALAQIAALQAEKSARTPAQQKINSNLLLSSQLLRGAPLPAILKTVGVSREAQPDAHGMVLVDIKADVSDALLSRIAAAGGVVTGAWPRFGAIRAALPLAKIEAVAGEAAVHSIRPAEKAHTVRTRITPPPAPLVPGLPLLPAPAAQSQDQRRRQERVQAALPGLLARVAHAQAAPQAAAPALASLTGGLGGLNTADREGDYAHRADLARQTFHVTGSGVRIGVISDSVDGLAQEQRRGSLGPVTILPGQSGVPGSGEGTAMLEIVHRVAPGAQLYFATAFGSEAGFAQNILALKAAGCQVIVDDVSYFDEPPFQDGIVAQAVDAVSAAGSFYFSSAGNNFNLDQFGITATWEGDFVDSGGTLSVGGGPAQPILAYDAAGDNLNQVLTAPSLPYQSIFLFWADPQSTATSGATDDYDLYVLDPTASQILYFSTDPHTGLPGQDPIQACEADRGDLVLVTKNHGNAVDLHLFLTSDGAAALNIATDAGTYGHDCAKSAYGTAAVDASIDYKAGHTFQSTDVTEYFSSDGPRRIFFDADGTAITPGNFLAATNGGELRQKPVLAAADGITDFFSPFYGTSAAAPHAAAIAGLVLSAKPTLNSQQMFDLLTTSCLPIDTDFGPLPNRDTGYGLLDAYEAVQKAARR